MAGEILKVGEHELINENKGDNFINTVDAKKLADISKTPSLIKEKVGDKIQNLSEINKGKLSTHIDNFLEKNKAEPDIAKKLSDGDVKALLELKSFLSSGSYEDQEYNKDKLTINKIKSVSDMIPNISPLPDKNNDYSKPIVAIRGMKWNESEIPLENRDQIVNAINSLGEFEKINIKGCTDGNVIDKVDGIDKNKVSFQNIREKYIIAGGSCPSYDQLLQSPQDPQNTVLGYRRAMEGVLSLNLNSEQIKKVEIANVLGKDLDNAQERGFDIEANYTNKVVDLIKSETNDSFYKFLGELDLNSISYNYDNLNQSHDYYMNNIDLKTTINPDKPTELYTRIMGNIPQALSSDPVMQEKIQNQVKGFLRGLIYSCGGEYNNGVWSAKKLTRKQYYTITATHDKIISPSEFKSIIQDKDISVLENKQLESGKTLNQLLEENKDNPITGAGNQEGGLYVYYVENGNKKPASERKISKNDYIMLGLYFQMKNS